MKRTKLFLGLAAFAVGLGMYYFFAASGAKPVVGPAGVESAAIAGVNATISPSASVNLPTNQTPTVRGTLPYVVKSTVAIDKPLRLAIEAFGAKTVDSLSRKSLLIEATPAVRDRILGDSRFQEVVELEPSSKIQPELLALVNGGAKEVEVSILSLAAVDRDAVLGMLAQNGGALLTGCINEGSTIRAKLPAEAVATLAKRGEVRWMEHFVRPQFTNNLAVDAPQMNVREVWSTHGLTGKGQHISTSDTGIDSGVLGSLHADLNDRVKDIQVVSGCSTSDTNGHGTHTSGSIVGNGTKSDGNIKGTAYEANLYAWFCQGTDGYVYTPTEATKLYLNDGAWTTSVHSASWGSAVSGQYNSECYNHDLFAWEHPEFLPVFSAGNSGCDNTGTTIIPMSICAPGSAKNVLAVGATQNARSDHDGGWGNGDPTKTVKFSSRGPCQDGRTKPDIAAPGCGILSTRSHGVDYSYGNYDEWYAYDSGTSMSCPLTAGAVALTRQWLVEKMGFEDVDGKRPTAALMKAVIMGGAKGASVPNNDQGWGRVDLEQTLFPTNGLAVKLIDRIPFAPGFMTNIVVFVTNSTPLDVQLVWIDYPGSASGDQSTPRLVNDLDLIVERDDGPVMYGNGGSEPDTLNNAESVRISNAVSRACYYITVDCKSILHDHTEGGAAALYIRGAFDPDLQLEVPKRVALLDRNEGFFMLDQALAAVTNDGEVVVISNDVSYTKSVTLTNSCTIKTRDSHNQLVRCSEGKTFTASGAGVNVVVDKVFFYYTCAGFIATGGATWSLDSPYFDKLQLLKAEAGSTNIVNGPVVYYGDGPSVVVEDGALMNMEGADLHSLSNAVDWEASGKLVLNGCKLVAGQTVRVKESGNLTLCGKLENLDFITFDEAKESCLTLGNGISPTSQVQITSPGASEAGDVIGIYTCDGPTAEAAGKFLVNALDPEGELAAAPNTANGTIYWSVVQAPEAAAGAILDDDNGTSYYYMFKSAMRARKGDARITIKTDSNYGKSATLTNDLTLVSTNDAILVLAGDAQFNIAEGAQMVLTNITVAGGSDLVNDCAFKVAGGELVLDGGATLSGLSDRYKYGKSYGGSVVVSSGSVTMKSGSLIEDCASQSNGGAIWLGGTNSTANLFGGEITGCTAKNTYGGGAVYSCLKANVNVQGDFTATDNTMGSSAADGNLYLSRDTAFALTDAFTGELGVSFGKKSGLSDLNLEGEIFIDTDGVSTEIAASAAYRFLNDKDGDLFGDFDSDLQEIVWISSDAFDGQCDESVAGVRVKADGETDYRYYPNLTIAFWMLDEDATVETIDDELLGFDAEIVSNIRLVNWAEKANNPTVYRQADLQWVILPGGSLTISNVTLSGETATSGNKSTIGLVSVNGGSLTLGSGAKVIDVTGSASRASNAITVWNGGTLTMESGSSIENCVNNYENSIDATGCGGGILLDNSTAYFNGGTVNGCAASRAGGVYVANKTTAYVSGDFAVTGNTDLHGFRNNMVVGDLSYLVLSNALTGSVGLNEGISCDTNWFGTVEWEWPSIDALTNSAAKFFHDGRGVAGTAVTNGTGEAVLVWSDWLSKAGSYVDDDGDEYRIFLGAGVTVAVPQQFSVATLNNGTKLGFTIDGGVEGCWYTVYATDSLSEPFQAVKSIQLKANEEFVFEIDAKEASQFYKIVAEEGLKGL